MKFTTTKAHLLRAAEVVADVAEERGALSIYKSAEIDARDGLVVRATRSSQEASIAVDATVDEAGRVLVSAKNLMERAKSFDSGEVEISGDERMVVLTQGRRVHSLLVIDGELPRQQEPKSPWIQVDSTAWQASIRRLVPLMGRDDSRATYLGLRFASDHRGQRMLATEGKVFARVGVGFDIGTTTIVPPRAVEHIVKSIGKDVSVAVDGARFHVKSGGVSYSTTTIAGPYPDIEAIFDARSGHSVMFSKEKAQEALGAVLCCNPFQERIRMVPTGGGFYLRAKSIDGEPAEEFVDAEGSLPSFSVSKFCLQKALNFSGENVTIWMEECERRTGGGAQSALVTSELSGELVFAPVALDHEDLK